jgi:diguanylate cyclase (GGDEF)-like protein
MHTDKQLGRRLTRTYITALTLIAVLSGAVHFLLDYVIASQSSNAEIINIAGRQRMLSQRIGMSAISWVQSGDLNARERLVDSAAVMKRTHEHLTGRTNSAEPHVWLSPAISSLYFEEPARLDRRTLAFVEKAQLLGIRRDPELLADIAAEADGPLLADLDKAVTAFEMQAKAGIDQMRRAQRFVLVILLVTLLCEALFIFRPLVSRVLIYAAQLVELATRDGLTTLHNRRSFLDLAQHLTQTAQRNTRPCTLLMFDIDHFKRINDSEGHATGDEVLRRFAEVLLHAAAGPDLVARMGGEEFVMLLPDTNGITGELRAQAVRDHVHALNQSQSPAFTVSIGVAEIGNGEGLSGLLRRADDALYCAKRAGRDQIVTAPPSESDSPLPALV